MRKIRDSRSMSGTDQGSSQSLLGTAAVIMGRDGWSCGAIVT